MLKEFFNNGIDTVYFIDNETFKVYRSGKKGKLLYVPFHKSKYGISVNVYGFYDNETGRLRSRHMYLSKIMRYVYDIKRKYIIEYRDGNFYNFTKENIVIRYLTDICPTWKRCEDSVYYISSKGDLYDSYNVILISPTKSREGYYYLHFNGKHYKRCQLVWKYFGSCDIKLGYVIDHINNIAYDDRIENLQCVTIRENNVKEHKRDLPTGVIRDGKRYRAVIGYTINGIRYKQMSLGSFENAEDAGECYKRALGLVERGINPIKSGDNKNIHYRFKDDTWYFFAPMFDGHDRLYDSFKSYEEAYNMYINVVEYDTTDEDDIERYLRKGIFSFRYYDKCYCIRKKKFGDEEFVKLINFYCKCRNEKKMNLFIETFDFLCKEIEISDIAIKEKKMLEKEEKIIINNKLKELKKEEELKLKYERMAKSLRYKYDFAKKENYVQNKYNSGYTVNVPHIDGKRYYLCSFMSKDIVDEIDNIMNQHKYDVDFPDWFNGFKKNELSKYIERDNAARSMNFNMKMGYKGYNWFKPRNCWRVNRKYNKKTYCLGYYDKEECCKYINKECDKAIEEGRFNEWYKNIELHKLYVRNLFNDNKLKNNIIKNKAKMLNFNKSVNDTENMNTYSNKKKILQLENGNIINEFLNYTEAAKQFNNSDGYKFISKCCRGLKKSYKGYEWKFE